MLHGKVLRKKKLLKFLPPNVHVHENVFENEIDFWQLQVCMHFSLIDLMHSLHIKNCCVSQQHNNQLRRFLVKRYCSKIFFSKYSFILFGKLKHNSIVLDPIDALFHLFDVLFPTLFLSKSHYEAHCKRAKKERSTGCDDRSFSLMPYTNQHINVKCLNSKKSNWNDGIYKTEMILFADTKQQTSSICIYLLISAYDKNICANSC